ncbi:cupin domain-containing protein [Humidesulfovibrio idahonensis]
MPPPPDNATMTLAGLAAANRPWLSVRLGRLAELSNLPLPRDLVESAVVGSSKVLAEVLNAEGHLSLNAAASDPVVQLGREQAETHQQAGLSMPASLKMQRLLRRAYDDLVRESWVERDSRARAHEDVEHFFERALAGLVATWTGHAAAPPDTALADLVAQREDELRRALVAAKKITVMMHQARADTEAAAAELARVREGEAGLTRERGQLKAALDKARTEAQALGARIRELEDERTALGGRLADLEMTLAAHGDAERARKDAEKELARVRAEADSARDKAERARFELSQLEQTAQDLRGQAEQRGQTAQAETAALRAELRALREAHANLASEAEAMRARLSETGSRLTEMRQAEEREIQARLDRAAEDLTRAKERIAALEADLRQAGQESRTAKAAWQERLGQAQAELAKAKAAQQDAAASGAALMAERDALAEKLNGQVAGQLDALRQELAQALAERNEAVSAGQALRAERDALAARLKDAETQLIRMTEDFSRTQVELLNTRAELEASGKQAEEALARCADLASGRDALALRLKAAEDELALARQREAEQKAAPTGDQPAPMAEFPAFMRHAPNRVPVSGQSTPGVDGYVFDGQDETQMAFWTCAEDARSNEHVHDFDEYMAVVAGRYTLLMQGQRLVLLPGQEVVIPRGVPHAAEVAAGTRTIHAFGGARVRRES